MTFKPKNTKWGADARFRVVPQERIFVICYKVSFLGLVSHAKVYFGTLLLVFAPKIRFMLTFCAIGLPILKTPIDKHPFLWYYPVLLGGVV